MREHEECEDTINAALAHGKDGQAEFLATRCDLMHGPQAHAGPQAAAESTDTERVQPVREALAGSEGGTA